MPRAPRNNLFQLIDNLLDDAMRQGLHVHDDYSIYVNNGNLLIDEMRAMNHSGQSMENIPIHFEQYRSPRAQEMELRNFRFRGIPIRVDPNMPPDRIMLHRNDSWNEIHPEHPMCGSFPAENPEEELRAERAYLMDGDGHRIVLRDIDIESVEMTSAPANHDDIVEPLPHFASLAEDLARVRPSVDHMGRAFERAQRPFEYMHRGIDPSEREQRPEYLGIFEMGQLKAEIRLKDRAPTYEIPFESGTRKMVSDKAKFTREPYSLKFKLDRIEPVNEFPINSNMSGFDDNMLVWDENRGEYGMTKLYYIFDEICFVNSHVANPFADKSRKFCPYCGGKLLKKTFKVI